MHVVPQLTVNWHAVTLVQCHPGVVDHVGQAHLLIRRKPALVNRSLVYVTYISVNQKHN